MDLKLVLSNNLTVKTDCDWVQKRECDVDQNVHIIMYVLWIILIDVHYALAHITGPIYCPINRAYVAI
jgi:hypothetical protein